MNFFDIVRKSTQNSLNSLKNSAIYEISKQKLEPKPYSLQAKPLYLLSQFFSITYHFVGYFIALIGIIIYALQLDSILHKSILILLSFILLAISEIAKGNASNTVFSSVARKEQPNNLFIIILLVTTVFSFCTSVWSAKESIYFASTNTKFSNIDSLQNAKIDSINILFATQISSIESSLQASQNTLQTSKNKWLKLATTKDLQASQNSLLNVLERKEKAIQAIQTNTNKNTQNTQNKGNDIAFFAAVLFAVFEVLNLVCYWFVYQYYQSCLLEQNIPFEGITKNITAAVHDAKDTITATVQNAPNFVPNYTTTPNVTATVQSTPNVPNFVPKETNKIGFVTATVPKKEAETTASVPTKDGNKICLYEKCKQPYTYKIHNQKFCSENCRIENYRLKNNKPFFKGKKGK